MAKKGKVPAVSVVPVEKAEEEDYVEDEMELLQVDVGDMVKLKQVLDETVANAVLEKVEEDYRLDNIKLGIMTAACLFAMVAQFSPIPFPSSRPLLGVCCCVYFMLSGLLQLITTFVDKDCILLTKAVEKPPPKNSNMGKYGLRIRSDLQRFSEFYTVIIEFQGLPDSPSVEQKWSVGKFFDVEGMFDEIGLMMAVESLYKRFEAGNFDKDQKEKKEQ